MCVTAGSPFSEFRIESQPVAASAPPGASSPGKLATQSNTLLKLKVLSFYRQLFSDTSINISRNIVSPMLIILLLFALIRIFRGISPHAPYGNPTLDIRDPEVHFGQRGVSDIVISCFATIFACIWSAIHPNIPAPTDSWWTCFKRQVVTMKYALLAPELITIWALRQRLAAKRIMNEYNKRIEINGSEQTNDCKTSLSSALGAIRALFQNQTLPAAFQKDQAHKWTLTHAFFLQMGGFVLCEEGRPIQTLTDSANRNEESTTLMWNIDNKIIDPPQITPDDIQDRSKGDAISKAFVILQTTWFIAQCLARWASQLPVTELEVATLAFATLNGITYGLWWDKPQNVGRPVFLESKQPREVPVKVLTRTRGSDSRVPRHVKESRLRSILRQDIEEFKPTAPWILLGRIPMRLLEALISPMTSLAGNTPSAVRSSDLRVARFYATFIDTNTENKTVIAYTAIGVLFGFVHLIPSWFLDFSSRQEMWLWRAAAVVITTGPIFSSLTIHLARKFRDPRIFFIPLCVGVPLYVVSRITLLILPLISLHSLSPNALETIEWTTFIPHL